MVEAKGSTCESEVMKSKACPACKFADCFVNAKICEKCGYDFVTKKRPRKRRDVVDLEEAVAVPVVVIPAVKLSDGPMTKTCPACKFADCFAKASRCENCGHDFLKPLVQVDEKKKKEEEEQEHRIPVGIRPMWSEIKEKIKSAEPWVEGYNGNSVDALKAWARKLLDCLNRYYKDKIYPPCVLDWVEGHTENEKLKASAHLLAEIYQTKSGVLNWIPDYPNKCWRGEVMTSDEQDAVWRDIAKTQHYVSAHTHNRVVMLPPDQVSDFRERETGHGRNYIAFAGSMGQVGSLWLLPESWASMPAGERARWAAERVGTPMESLEAKKFTEKKRKTT